MKRHFIAFGLLVAAAFAFTNCAQKEAYEPVQEETSTFEIIAKLPADTKTYNDGISTKWEKNDSLKVTYTYLFGKGEFEAPFTTSGDGHFKSNVGSLLGILQGAFAWSFQLTAYYPFKSYSNGQVAIPSSTVQESYGSMAHLAGKNCPLSGSVTINDIGQTVETPEVILNHLTSVIKVEVVNATASAIEVSEVDFLVDGEVTATTMVENAGSLAAGKTAEVYVVVKPGTYSNLSFTVNDTYVKNITAEAATFTAGMIKPVKFEIK